MNFTLTKYKCPACDVNAADFRIKVCPICDAVSFKQLSATLDFGNVSFEDLKHLINIMVKVLDQRILKVCENLDVEIYKVMFHTLEYQEAEIKRILDTVMDSFHLAKMMPNTN